MVFYVVLFCLLSAACRCRVIINNKYVVNNFFVDKDDVVNFNKDLLQEIEENVFKNKDIVINNTFVINNNFLVVQNEDSIEVNNAEFPLPKGMEMNPTEPQSPDTTPTTDLDQLPERDPSMAPTSGGLESDTDSTNLATDAPDPTETTAEDELPGRSGTTSTTTTTTTSGVTLEIYTATNPPTKPPTNDTINTTAASDLVLTVHDCPIIEHHKLQSDCLKKMFDYYHTYNHGWAPCSSFPYATPYKPNDCKKLAIKCSKWTNRSRNKNCCKSVHCYGRKSMMW